MSQNLDIGVTTPPPSSPALPPLTMHFPYVSSAILAVLCLIFAAEQIFAVTPPTGLWDVSVPTLHAMGGLSRNAVLQDGEWYRLFSAPLLHGNLMHLLGNGISLIFAGMMLEHIIGRAWFGATYVIGGLTGALFSLLLNAPDVVSIGASGAITAIFATICLVSFLYPPEDRQQLQTYSMRVLIPAILPAFGAGSGGIDYWAHIGGALGGTAVGYLFLNKWPQILQLHFQKAAKTISVAGVILAVGTAVLIAPGLLSRGLLIPNDQLPKTTAEGKTQSEHLVAAYPQDPRSHFYRALVYTDQRDLANAENEIRQALANKDVLRMLPASWEPLSKALLKFTLYERAQEFQKQNQPDQALAAFDEIISIEVPSMPQNERLQASLDNLTPHYYRGMLRLLKLDKTGALQDLDEEIRRHPKAYDVYWARGRARFHMSEYKLAAADFRSALEADPKTEKNYGYYALWLYLAQKQMNELAEAELKSNMEKLPSGSWPYPIAHFYLGNSSAALLLVGARNADQRCEADFYLAQWHLFRGAKEAAIPLLQSNTSNYGCPKYSYGYTSGLFHGYASALELHKLGL